jgi:glycine/D-amino acid oxidase-like deaminating enzyme/nitrite reductase/ring-hydroxylating ferredoxin subunit
MRQSSGERQSIWGQDAGLDTGQRLDSNTEADVCVVGAGIAGLTTAYMLAQRGRSVVVLDDGGVGGGETSRTTAHLANALDDRYFELERLHGVDGARLAADSHTQAITAIESIVRQEQIACGFERVNGYLFLAPGDDSGILARELDAAHRVGLTGVHRVEQAPMPSRGLGPSLCFPEQAQFHPLKYLAGVARAIRERGGRIHTRVHVNAVEGGEGAQVRTSDGYVVRAGAIVVATNTPVNDRVVIHTKQSAYRTYAIAMAVAAGATPRALFWDTADPYHYVRLTSTDDGADLLIVGGEDHKTGQADDTDRRFSSLAGWARERFPVAGEVTCAWSGQVMEPVDSLAFIGPNPDDAPNVYVATGDSGNGMTHGTIAGILLTDLIMGRDNPWATLYEPSRITLRAGFEYTRENLNVAAQYADLLGPGEIASPEELAPHTGAIMRQGTRKVAIYRNQQGAIQEFSALCPHLGCAVSWNDTEKTWDCPCHGSRFEATGAVINGPAITGLRPE